MVLARSPADGHLGCFPVLAIMIVPGRAFILLSNCVLCSMLDQRRTRDSRKTRTGYRRFKAGKAQLKKEPYSLATPGYRGEGQRQGEPRGRSAEGREEEHRHAGAWSLAGGSLRHCGCSGLSELRHPGRRNSWWSPQLLWALGAEAAAPHSEKTVRCGAVAPSREEPGSCRRCPLVAVCHLLQGLLWRGCRSARKRVSQDCQKPRGIVRPVWPTLHPSDSPPMARSSPTSVTQRQSTFSEWFPESKMERWKEAWCFCDFVLLQPWEDAADFPALCLGGHMLYNQSYRYSVLGTYCVLISTFLLF